ncbi:hypothetical protein A6A40_19210 (plasmid) [Azospirillum humicireducens]|uniref:HTH araC/xylS-type domain-containing protein n=2 Tax=Azospirillum humicireducens TaxID=1226968 RepID=A0A2R4VRY6_9PROT|nr:hypothetical protein A6A40_19210 [Azospirillum humicireducens]
MPLAPDIQLSAGVLAGAAPPTPLHDVGAWRTIVQVLDGPIRWRIGGATELDLSTAALCVVDTPSLSMTHHLCSAGSEARCAVIQIGPAAMPGDDGSRPCGGADATSIVVCKDIDSGLGGLVAQILACPFDGFTRHHYLTGKGLELTALGLRRASSCEPFLQGASQEPHHHQVWLARRILESSFDRPPVLREIARQVGLNPGKLTAEFRRKFGVTVHEYLQEFRLARAFHLLSEDRVNASVAAHRVGYSTAYFSTVFRKRFGFSPSNVNGRFRGSEIRQY